MSLADKLDALRKAFAAKLPAEAQAVMHRATEDLRASGLAERAVGVGDRMPVFALPDAGGEVVRSDDLVARGPLIVTFFRGRW